jgi:nitrogen regulatory protein PII
MELLVCVINDPSKVDEILEAFLEIGITGATIIDTYGMGRTLVQDVPIFAGFRNLLSGPSKYNKTLFSVIDSKEKVDNAIKAIEAITGELENPSTGIVFTIPLSHVKGLSPGL